MTNKNKFILYCIFLFSFSAKLFAQSEQALPANPAVSDTLRKQQDSLASQRDIIDYLHKLFHKKGSQPINPITKRFNYSVVPSAGYTLSTGLAASLTGNVAWFAEPLQHENLSSVISILSYNQKSQLTFRIISNVWSKDNDYNFVGDFRLYKFPENTYGLGSLTSLDELNPMKYNFVRFYETVLKKLEKNFYGGLGYNLDYHYDIMENGKPNQSVTDYQIYGKTTTSVSSGIAFNLLYDNRKNSINARNGTYVNLIYRPDLKLLGSDTNWQLLSFDFRKYIPLTTSGKSVLAFWTLENFTLSGQPPYFDLPSTGWDMAGNTGRGYAQGRFRGKNMLYAETEYRFDLTNNGFFGGVLFVNGETFSDYPNNRFQKVIPGYGPGLRIKFNKRSATNICIDYGFGINGSHGLFVNLGEVF
ncbi:BamA/TamA family outer membrane protein [Mucilaginibacter arboris]|uniref:BamA/TamA family outer membrane protein n=1 Tax=Mucilaginibacter arboris TaxID=2682090 RepID=A0A7K1T0M7_9SPHI|nr:BamA/TamA family outer membrane protein [Mucilaginibacter arboris]MVN23115.1 BamA/TamA family outer membrane protein [Mucilaginibacter arboris]